MLVTKSNQIVQQPIAVQNVRKKPWYYSEFFLEVLIKWLFSLVIVLSIAISTTLILKRKLSSIEYWTITFIGMFISLVVRDQIKARGDHIYGQIT